MGQGAPCCAWTATGTVNAASARPAINDTHCRMAIIPILESGWRESTPRTCVKQSRTGREAFGLAQHRAQRVELLIALAIIVRTRGRFLVLRQVRVHLGALV